MQTFMAEGVVTALSSIAHNGETLGINAKLRREKVVQADGSVEEVPVISGNGVRGLLRDRGMLHMCAALGYGVNVETGEVRGLSLPAFYFLFSGGSLTKGGGGGNKALNYREAQAFRALIPLVGVFGGGMGNEIMPGRLKVGKLVPIVEETRGVVPERYHAGGISTIWDWVQEEAYTRKDDEKDDRLRGLLSGGEAVQLEMARDVRDGQRQAGVVALKQKDEQKQQMRYYVETLAAGARFYWWLALDDPSPLEYDALLCTLAQFAHFPHLGGKSAIGLGKVSVKFDSWLEINPFMSVEHNPVGLQAGPGQAYSQHLEAHGAEIREALDALG